MENLSKLLSDVPCGGILDREQGHAPSAEGPAAFRHHKGRGAPGCGSTGRATLACGPLYRGGSRID